MQNLLSEECKKIFIPLGIIIFFLILPFGNFLFKGVDLWNGTGLYVQTGILIIFSLSLFKYNKPLTFLTLWLGLFTILIWYEVISQAKQYPIKIFFPFFNFLSIVILYKLLLKYLNAGYLQKLLEYFSYSLLILLFYCVIQYFNLDQFFKHYSQLDMPDALVGTIGNSSHLAGFLAIILPFFFNNIYALILIGLLILLCGSASGVITAVSVILFYLFHTKRKWFYYGLSASAMGITAGLIFFRHFFSFSGRLEIWKEAFNIFKENPITGIGLGTVNLIKLSQVSNNSIWRHLHQEYYQLAIEAGLIALGLIIWCIYDYFRTFTAFKTDLTIKFASIFFGFCILSLFSFPCHLWLLSTMGILSYSSIYVIKKERLCEQGLK